MSNWNKDLAFGDENMPPIVQFFRDHAKEGQAIYIRGEGNFAKLVRRETHSDIVANSFLTYCDSTPGIEVKIRRADKERYQDILIETRSCTNPGRESKGWIHTCTADLLCYANLSSGGYIRLRVLDLPKLQQWVQTIDLTRYEYITTWQSNHTECVAIPWEDIPLEFLVYSGYIDENGEYSCLRGCPGHEKRVA